MRRITISDSPRNINALPDAYLEWPEADTRRLLADHPPAIYGTSIRGLTLVERLLTAGIHVSAFISPEPLRPIRGVPVISSAQALRRPDTIIVASLGAADIALKFWRRRPRAVRDWTFFYEGGASPFRLGWADPGPLAPATARIKRRCPIISIDLDYARPWTRYRVRTRCAVCRRDWTVLFRATLMTDLRFRCPADGACMRFDPEQLVRMWGRRARVKPGARSRMRHALARWDHSEVPLASFYAPPLYPLLNFAGTD